MNPLIISNEDFKKIKEFGEVETTQIQLFGDPEIALGSIVGVTNESKTEIFKTKIIGLVEVPTIPKDSHKAYKCHLEKID